jgi:hypothetical protein
LFRVLTIHDGGCQFLGCCESRYVEGHHIKQTAASKPQRFAQRLCFSKVDRYFDAPFNRLSSDKEKDFVIAANPAKFTCACVTLLNWVRRFLG